MWILACVLAVVVLFRAVPTQAHSSHVAQRPTPLLTAPVNEHSKWRP